MNDGLLLIDKHSGCTSHDIVAAVRRVLRFKKIGHCGTLDPAATGLLLLTLGRATRLTRFLIRASKAYEGTGRLGVTTDTYDLTGEVTAEGDTEDLSAEAVATAMEGFAGAYLQTPPPYCAKKIGGVKYYELARRGEQVPDEKTEITVFEFLPSAPWQPEEDLRFHLACSSGTYARSLVHELGLKLGCGASLSGLRRTLIGSFRVEDAISIEELRRRDAELAGAAATEDAEAGATGEAGKGARGSGRAGRGGRAASARDVAEITGGAWIPFDQVPLPFGEVVADAQQERRILHGQTFLARDLEGQEGDWVKVINQRRRFIAVGSVMERIGTRGVGVVQPKVVFN